MLRFRTQSKQQSWRRDWPLYLVLTILATVTYIPFVFTIINSLKSNTQFFTQFWLPVLPFHLENYERALPSMLQAILNSFSYSIPTLILSLLISGLTGYAFARYRFPGRQILFFAMLALIMIPGILLVIPMFSVIISFGWGDTIQGVVLPWTAVDIVFGTFLMRTFFETLPQEYFEAARLDGAGEITLLFRIALPLAVPALATLGILNLLFTWNDIIWPLVSIFDSARFPVSIGVLTFSSQYGTDYGITFASYVIASLPLIVIFAFTSRRFMEGLSGGLSI
ncbi:MAG: carbohydrate ABC transporter permease [Anaerolineae bacterium]|nr:carbohydrate ABC transporter permease [Anaerolineae bacterium]